MGDKSPKSKERQKKQDTAEKNEKSQKKADDWAKSHPDPSAKTRNVKKK